MLTQSTLLTGDLGGFPPGRRFLLLPRRPRRATAAALALYEAVEPRQRVMVAAMRAGAAVGAGRFLRPVRQVPPGLDQAWWAAWLDDVAAAHVPRPAAVAFRVPPNGRTSALLLDDAGAPLAFAKVLSSAPSQLHAHIAAAMAEADLPFSTPRVLDQGRFQEVEYRLDRPMPEGGHRRPPVVPQRVRAAVDAWQSALRAAPRPADVAASDVVCHGDFTPRNLRVAADGCWWLIDWDNARWGPRLADELHYWCADRAWRLRHRLDRDTAWILARLRERGTAAEIAAAASWADAPSRTYRAAEQRLRAAVGELASGGGHGRR